MMRYKALIPSLLVMTMVGFSVQSAKEFSPGKQRLPRKRKPLDMRDLVQYVKEFLALNPALMDNLSHASDTLLSHWSKKLAHKIEERYILFPSTFINRLSHHATCIFHILILCRKKARHALLKKPIDIQPDAAKHPVAKKNLRLLLQENRLTQKKCAEKMETLRKMVTESIESGEKEVHDLEGELLAMMHELNENYQSMLQSFMGLPQVLARKQLHTQWRFLRQQGDSLDHYIPSLLKHTHALHDLNQSMHEKIDHIFSDAHLGITPYSNKVMGLKWEMMQKAIAELSDIHAKLSENNRLALEQLCKNTAATLWVQWFKASQEEKKSSMPTKDTPVGTPEKALEKSSMPTKDTPAGTPEKTPEKPSMPTKDTPESAPSHIERLIKLFSSPIHDLDHFRALLSPHQISLTLSKELLHQACEQILHVLEKAQRIELTQSAPTKPLNESVVKKPEQDAADPSKQTPLVLPKNTTTDSPESSSGFNIAP